MKDFDPTQPSKGLGDTIAKITHYTGISKLTEVLTDALGIEDCGCGRRRELLNNEVSYETKPSFILDAGEYNINQNIKLKVKDEEYKFDKGSTLIIEENSPLNPILYHYSTIGALTKKQ